MKSPLQALIQMGVVPPVTFPTDSRYYGFEHADLHDADGEQISYLARRIVPQPGRPTSPPSRSTPCIRATAWT